MSEQEIFTPRNEAHQRLRFLKSEVEFLPGYKDERGLGLKGKVRIKGVLYNVYGAACDAPRCQCDAVIKKVN